ncbi:16S rRNA (adenine(1518)-N(6)/adenine(1519)-N(6))-dimethyltransferase RsmA [Eggerthellaceae bacterium zg-893]|nr:16S rRNA (adenine(1518)-N(6)/adenine(1519)-N(6))-dimethyltransferase RsmA [Eggerthellaceae bacterium zg-893]
MADQRNVLTGSAGRGAGLGSGVARRQGGPAHGEADVAAAPQAGEGGAPSGSPLANPKTTRAVLEAFGLSAKYALGQNFLVNNDVVKKILALADIHPNDAVLEVGPGIGTLALGLLQAGARVVAVERDDDLVPVLAQTCGTFADRFTLISGDALDLTADRLRQAAAANAPRPAAAESCEAAGVLPSKFVANLPYGVAATLILDYFERFDFLTSATVMVQKEVADRIAAVPGTKNYGAYTVKLRLYAQVEGKFLVGPGNFMPAPHVDSAVVRLVRRQLCDEKGTPVPPEDVRAAALMADAAFASRRKTLANSCKTFFSGRGAAGKHVAAQLSRVFEAAAIDPRRRGETLDCEEFLRLGRAYRAVVEA